MLLLLPSAVSRTSLLLLLLASSAVPLDSQASGPKQYGKHSDNDGREI